MSQAKPSVGVVGAGRVGAVLAAALRNVGYPIAAVAGESQASRIRIDTLLPGIPVTKPTAVARGCELLLLAVPDDVLDNVVRMLVGSGAIHSGQYVVHTSGRHGLAVLEPATAIGAHGLAMHPAMTFTGTDVDLDRLAGCVFGVTAAPRDWWLASALAADLVGEVSFVPEESRTTYHLALAHGANHLVTLVSQSMGLLRLAGSDDPAATLRPLLTAALENALAYGDAALTGPIVRGDLRTVRSHLAALVELVDSRPELRPTMESYVVLARATANRAVVDGRLAPARAAAVVEMLNDALAAAPA